MLEVLSYILVLILIALTPVIEVLIEKQINNFNPFNKCNFRQNNVYSYSDENLNLNDLKFNYSDFNNILNANHTVIELVSNNTNYNNDDKIKRFKKIKELTNVYINCLCDDKINASKSDYEQYIEDFEKIDYKRITTPVLNMSVNVPYHIAINSDFEFEKKTKIGNIFIINRK